jgi:hypothetical protein
MIDGASDFSQLCALCANEIDLLSKGDFSAVSSTYLPFYRKRIQEAIDQGKLLPYGDIVHPAIMIFLDWERDGLFKDGTNQRFDLFEHHAEMVELRRKLEALLKAQFKAQFTMNGKGLAPICQIQEQKILESYSKRPVLHCLWSVVWWNEAHEKEAKVFVSPGLLLKLTEKRGTYIREVFSLYRDSIKQHNIDNGFINKGYHTVISQELWDFCSEQMAALALLLSKERSREREGTKNIPQVSEAVS